MCLTTFLMIGTMALLIAVGSKAAVSEAYQGPEPADDKVAILDWSGWNSPRVSEIDGRAVDGGGFPQSRARLLPGKHHIRYGGCFGASVLRGPRWRCQDESAVVYLRAGRIYRAKRERVYGHRRDVDYQWIEDTTTGEVIAGKLPPHAREEARRSERAKNESALLDHFDALSVSAGCGDAQAQYALALYYLTGIEPVSRRDLTQAYFWYSNAASQQYADAAVIKERLGKELSLKQLAEAGNLAVVIGVKQCPVASKILSDRLNSIVFDE